MGKTGDDAPATLTRYSPGSSPRMPNKPLPSVVVVRAACDGTDSIVTTAPSPASVYPITEPVFGGVLRGAAAEEAKTPRRSAARKSSPGGFGIEPTAKKMTPSAPATVARRACRGGGGPGGR